MALSTLRCGPLPVLRSLTDWTTRAGIRRRVRLYGAWKNMRGRLSGRLHAGDGSRPWVGRRCLFLNWHHFRAWSIANGYSRTLNSLDRFFDFEDYGPDTCRWVTRAQNSLNMTRGICAARRQSDRPVGESLHDETWN